MLDPSLPADSVLDTADESAPAGVTLHGLDPAEHLLVWALRTIAVGHADCPMLARAFVDKCGPMGAPALQAYFTLIKLIGASSRRRMQVHMPGCLCVSFDERAVVGIVSAAQAAVTGQGDALLTLRLGFLTRPEAEDGLRATAQALARAMVAGGQSLPLRLDASPRMVSAPRLATVH